MQAHPTIPGLSYATRYLPPEEEQALLGHIDAAPWRDDLKRRVQHYGYRYDYRARRVDSSSFLGPLPTWLMGLAGRLQGEGWFSKRPDQAIVNEYEPGQGIRAHTDCVPCFGPEIASLTLGGGCTMEFSWGEQRGSLWLSPGSLLLLRGPARYEWRHGIAARKRDTVEGGLMARARRVSVTFRRVVLEKES